MLVPVILCGGSGTRLWPLSRRAVPKQLLALNGERTLLQQTAARLEGLPGPVAEPLVVCNEAHRFLVEQQLAGCGRDPLLILEPEGRNTAPAIALAALEACRRHGDDCLLLVLSADHAIADSSALVCAIATALPAAEAGSLVTFGVPPTRPETGYGYIAAAGESPAPGVSQVERFIEKPDAAAAARYMAEGCLWNTGMFLFRADRILQELGRHAPELLAACEQAAAGARAEGRFLRPDAEPFRACPADSIDYAVMERTESAAVVPLASPWSDVGSFPALQAVSPLDEQGNSRQGDVLALDCRNSYLRAESRLLAAVGLEDCIVIETPDAVLVAPHSHSQQVKALVDELGRQQRPEIDTGREVLRPWGSFDSLHGAKGYQVKRLTVLPGARLSLQLHNHRAEHWVVVAGTARITRDEEEFDLGPGGHVHIPVGARHRIENPGSEPVQIIEVQLGAYLGEDDIVRLDDAYGRTGRTD
ncbi:MAG: mannose-1-phosphate guanylyltransferase/mannose-6-phosphate isomerase [Chromatiales bacterium]|nr:mannose-1-phosphate guanylyltransferase/mannose-6-phosphate isomerase [Chromatiales bacterium]